MVNQPSPVPLLTIIQLTNPQDLDRSPAHPPQPVSQRIRHPPHPRTPRPLNRHLALPPISNPRHRNSHMSVPLRAEFRAGQSGRQGCGAGLRDDAVGMDGVEFREGCPDLEG